MRGKVKFTIDGITEKWLKAVRNRIGTDAMIKIQDAARLLKITDQRIRRMCVAGKLTGAREINGKWEIPVIANPRFSGIRKTMSLAPSILEQVKDHGNKRGCQSFSESIRDLVRIALGKTKTQDQKDTDSG